MHTHIYTANLANRGSKSKKSKPKPKAPPLVINASGADDSVYEAIGSEYEAVPAGLDYTYPTPSPTVKYNPKTEEVFISDGKGPSYHAQGPDAGNHYDYCGSGTAYNTLGPQGSSLDESNQYEAPTLPKFRVSVNCSLYLAFICSQFANSAIFLCLDFCS